MVLQKAGKFSKQKTVDNKKLRKRQGRKLIEESAFGSKEPESEKKGGKMKPELYPIPPEDSFIPLQEDSEEIKYNTGNNVS